MSVKTLPTGAVADLAKGAVESQELDDIFSTPAGDIDLANLGKEDVDKTEVKPDKVEVAPVVTPVDDDEVTEVADDTTEQATDETEPAPVTPVVLEVDRNQALIDALKLAFPQAQAPQPVVQHKQLTQEEIDTALNVWKPTKEWIEKFQNPETMAEALLEQSQGVARQAATMANVLQQERETAQQAQLAPLLQAQREQAVKSYRDEFDSTYPQLAKPEYEPLLKLVTDSLQAQGFNPKSRTEAFQTIAASAEKLIAGVVPGFKLTAPKTQTPKTTMPKLPTTTSGSGGGGGGKPSAPAVSSSRSKGTEVFD